MLASGQISLDAIVNRIATLEAWPDCFESMHEGALVKVVLKPNGIP